MISIDIFSGLSPLVQVALIVGFLIVILSIAFSRTAATNLIAFLRELRATYSQYRQHKQYRSLEQETACEGEQSSFHISEEQAQPMPLSGPVVSQQQEQERVEQLSDEVL